MKRCDLNKKDNIKPRHLIDVVAKSIDSRFSAQRIADYLIWIIVSFAVILLVHILFKIEAPFSWLVPNWSAGEALGYCGAIIGAVVAVNVVVRTLEREKELGLESRRLEIKPLIALTEFKEIPFDQVKNVVQAHRRGTIIVLLKKRDRETGVLFDIEYLDEITGRVEKLIVESLRNEDNDSGLKLELVPDGWLFILKEQNVGSGPAINLSLRIEGDSIETREVEGKPCHSPIRQLPKNESIQVLLWVEDNKLTDKQQGMTLVIKYNDQDNRTYEQRHALFCHAESSERIRLLDFKIDQTEISE